MRRVTSDRFSDGKALMTDWIPGGDAVIKGGAILEVHIEREGMNKRITKDRKLVGCRREEVLTYSFTGDGNRWNSGDNRDGTNRLIAANNPLRLIRRSIIMLSERILTNR